MMYVHVAVDIAVDVAVDIAVDITVDIAGHMRIMCYSCDVHETWISQPVKHNQ